MTAIWSKFEDHWDHLMRIHSFKFNKHKCPDLSPNNMQKAEKCARDSLPPEVWHVMELMGYQSMCMSENVDVLRGQFIRAWERQEQLRQERAAILPVLPEGVKEKYLAIGDGEEGEG